MIHSLKNPIDAYIIAKYIVDEEDEQFDNLIPCKIIGICSYAGKMLSVQILILDSYLYTDVPIHYIVTKNDNIDPICSSYGYCDTEDVQVYTIDYLINKNVCFRLIKNDDRLLHGTYLLSINFTDGKDQFHLIECIDGSLLFMPNHEINFSDVGYLPNFKEIKS